MYNVIQGKKSNYLFYLKNCTSKNNILLPKNKWLEMILYHEVNNDDINHT